VPPVSVRVRVSVCFSFTEVNVLNVEPYSVEVNILNVSPKRPDLDACTWHAVQRLLLGTVNC